MSIPLNLAEQLLLLALDEKGAHRSNWGTGVDALMEPYDLVGKVVEHGERRDAKRRAKALRREIGVAGAVGDAVRSARASAIAAVVAASSASASSGGDGGGGDNGGG